MLKGIDVSSYQGAVDWDKHKGFAIAKASEGRTVVDSQFARNWREMQRVGLVRGAYHFAHPGNNTAAAEVSAFLSRIPEIETGDLLALDLEVTDGASASHVAGWARDWCARTKKATGVTPLVYTYLSFAESGNCAGLGGYPLWIADPSRPAGKPRVPGPWKDWLLHQYGDKPLDMDIAHVSTAAQLRAYGAGGQEDDVAIVVSLGAGQDEAVQPGETQSIEWYTEYSDKHGMHDPQGSSLIVKDPYWAVCDALVRVDGLSAGAPVDIMWTRMNKDGTAVKDDAWRITYHAGPDGKLTVSHSGQLGVASDVRLRLRVYNPNSYAVTVAKSTMAKISLLKY